MGAAVASARCHNLAQRSRLHWFLQNPQEGTVSHQLVKDCYGCSVFPAEWDTVQHLKLFENCTYLPMVRTHSTEISLIPLFSHYIMNLLGFCTKIFSLRCWSVFCALQYLIPSVCGYLLDAYNTKELPFQSDLPFQRQRLHLILIDLASAYVH